jgi:hypothetical protein
LEIDLDFSICWKLSTDLFLGTTSVLTLSDVPVCNEDFFVLSLTGIGDGKHSTVMQFGDLYLSFLAGVEVTTTSDILNCGMVLDDLLFCCEPGVGI